MNRLALSAALLAALAACNLTYDREGLKYVAPVTLESCTQAGKGFCEGYGPAAYCADLWTDPANCGGCGSLCQPGVACVDMACAGGLSCNVAGSWSTCNFPEAPICVDTSTDPRNCGYCGHDCGTQACGAGICGGVGLAAVAPLAPVNGANWNDWVTGTSGADAADVACDPASTADCLNGGEVRVVRVPSRTSCTGLTATDTLGAFAWACSLDPSDGTVRFVSSRLAGAGGATPEVRLADLIDASVPRWRQNKVTVFADSGMTYVGETPSTIWWPSNPIAPLPADGKLVTPHTIYVADPSSPQVPVELAASQVGLVVLRGAALRPSTGGAAVLAQAALPGAPRDFLWIEGLIDASTSGDGVLLSGVRRSNVRSLTVTRDVRSVASVGLHLVGAHRNRIRLVNATRSATGVQLEGSTANDLRSIEASECGAGLAVTGGSSANLIRLASVAANVQEGILVDGSDGNQLHSVISAVNGGAGLRISNARRTSLVNAVAAGNGQHGVELWSATDSRVVAVTAAGNREVGFDLASATANVILNAAVEGGVTGVRLTNSQGNTIADLAVADVATYALSTQGPAAGVVLSGSLLVGPTGSPRCDDGGVPLAGYDAFCTPMAPSYGTLQLIGPLSGAFVVPTTDAVNATPGGVGTVVNVADLDAFAMDWTGFETSYRSWSAELAGGGPLGCTDPAQRTQAGCSSVSGSWTGAARVWDWSLAAGGGDLFGRWADPLDAEFFSHQWSDLTATTFLRHDLERDTTAGGNGDGLCEAGEWCTFMPDVGAYQGHGALSTVGSVTFGTGAASVAAYLANGY